MASHVQQFRDAAMSVLPVLKRRSPPPICAAHLCALRSNGANLSAVCFSATVPSLPFKSYIFVCIQKWLSAEGKTFHYNIRNCSVVTPPTSFCLVFAAGQMLNTSHCSIHCGQALFDPSYLNGFSEIRNGKSRYLMRTSLCCR